MRSIRLSLTLCFVGLLAAALGTASLLAYSTARQTLEQGREAQEKDVQARYRERCREEESRLEDAVLLQAQTLARLTKFQFDRGPLRYQSLNCLGLLSAGATPAGYFLLAPTWVEQGAWWGPFYRDLWGRQAPEIKVNTGELLADTAGRAADYFQIDGDWGSTYHSESLRTRSFYPVVTTRSFARDQLVHWEWDNAWLDAETPVRRLTLKASAARLEFVDSAEAPRPTHPRGGPPPRRDRHDRGGPTILVQCAYPLQRRDAMLAGFAEQRDQELGELDHKAAAELSGLRGRLLAVATATFAAAVLGCYLLVRLGLAPLQRLSEAVSRVSPRDFHLPLDEPRLPQELRPIVGRLTATLDQLKRAFEREKQATADISHELRTPLAAMLTTTELALRKPRNPDEYREFLGECRLSAKQMNEVVERLLTLARLDAGVDALRPQALDAGQVAEQAAAVIRPLAEARGLRLKLHLPADRIDARVVADPDKLREALTNLLHNAIQYNRPGGSIDVTVGRDGPALLLEVRDTGVGIAPSALEHIFERFWRADPSRGRDGLHAGLGLAIVQEYVHLMGGTVTVDSVEGQGSAFRVRLPLARGAKA